MDKTEIADLIAGREEDIAGWQQDNANDLHYLAIVHDVMAERDKRITECLARIEELKQRMETGQWLTQ